MMSEQCVSIRRVIETLMSAQILQSLCIASADGAAPIKSK